MDTGRDTDAKVDLQKFGASHDGSPPRQNANLGAHRAKMADLPTSL